MVKYVKIIKLIENLRIEKKQTGAKKMFNKFAAK